MQRLKHMFGFASSRYGVRLLFEESIGFHNIVMTHTVDELDNRLLSKYYVLHMSSEYDSSKETFKIVEECLYENDDLNITYEKFKEIVTEYRANHTIKNWSTMVIFNHI